MTSGLFRGEEDIDKSQIIITDHAVKRFHDHSIENGLRTSEDPKEIKSEIWNWLNDASHKNAVSSVGRVKSLIDHGETYFFRCQRWQFIIKRGLSDPNKFLLVTILYLKGRSYELCFTK